MNCTNLSRRSFLAATAGVAALSPLARLASAASANNLNLGVQIYSLRNYKVDEALQHTRDLGFKFVEFYPGMYPIASDAAAIDTMKKKLADLGLTISAHGVNRFTKDAVANRKMFEFAKAAGIRNLWRRSRPRFLREPRRTRQGV
jgi:inosose dehydratase